MNLYDIANKPNKIILLTLFIFTVLTLLSCGGKPEADDTPIDSNAKIGLQVSDIIYSFENVPIGDSRTFKVTVSNSSNIPLTFDERSGPFEIINDQSPTENGYGEESFEISDDVQTSLPKCNVDNPDPIPKTGCTIGVKFTAQDGDEKQEIRTVLKISAKDKDGTVQSKYVTFKGSVIIGLRPSIKVATTAYIGSAQTDPIESDVVVYNTGAKALTINNFIISDTGTDNFAIEESSKTCKSPGGKVAKGSSCKIPISFTPPTPFTPGTYTAKLLIESDAGDATVTLSGLVKEPITIYPNNKVLDFGKVMIASPATSQIRITNNTSHDKKLTVTASPPNLPYTVNNCENAVVIKGSSCIVTVTVTPADTTTDLAAVITLTTKNIDDSSEYTEKLNTKAEPVPTDAAIAVLKVEPEFYTFNKLANYVNTTQSLNIINGGGADLTINSISIEDLGDFTISNSTCVDKLLLPPAESCSLDVTFNTSSGYERRSALDINTSAGTKILKMHGNAGIADVFGIRSNTPTDIRMTMPEANIFQVADSNPITLMNIGDAPITLTGINDIKNPTTKSSIVKVSLTPEDFTCGATLERGATCLMSFSAVTATKLDGATEKLVLVEDGDLKINIYLTANVLIPSFLKGTSVGQIYVNGDSVLAIDVKGDLYSWGDNEHAQLGVANTLTSPTYLTIPTYISVVQSSDKPLPPLSELVTSSEYTLGISKDRKTVYGWGTQKDNRIGIAGSNIDVIPTQLSLSDTGLQKVKKLYSGGSGFSILLHVLGGKIGPITAEYMESWGINDLGQTGQNSVANSTSISPIKNGDVKGKAINDIVVGYDFAFAIDSEGSIYAWGNNAKGQLALGANIDPVATPKKIDTGTVRFSKIFIDNGASVNVAALSKDNKLYAWGVNNKGQLGNGLLAPTTTVYQKVALPDNLKIVALYIGKDYKVARSSDGKIYGWGDNSNKLLKNTDDEIVATPVQIKMPDDAPVREVYTADDHIFAVTNDGTLYAWGKNDTKQLGLGDLAVANQPTLVKTPTPVSKLYLKNSFTFMLGTDGKLYAWGDNTNKNLGFPNATITIPQEVLMPNKTTVKDVYLGDTFTIILDTRGLLYSIGNNDNGQLGTGDSLDKAEPYSIFDTSLKITKP